MKKFRFKSHNLLLFFVLIITIPLAYAQKPIDAVLKQYNKENIPYISADSLFAIKNKSVLIDSREKEEFETSHIKNAIHIGYKNFNINAVKGIDKNQKIIVYCSLGVRSEVIANRLIKNGYTNVYNLYGGIFEWKNKNFPIVDNSGKETEKVHAFSEEWGVYLKKGIKVYE